MNTLGDTVAMQASLAAEMEAILAWWVREMPDEEQGGFYGRIDGRGRLHPQADKGVILNTRILWTFAAAARTQHDPEYRAMADRAWAYIRHHFLDEVEGGVFWMLDHLGEPTQTKKQVYAQAFAIYAFAEYYQLSAEPEALRLAMEIFYLLERYSSDKHKGGYLEAFSRDWQPLDDVRLSLKDDNAVKTMNTHLHLLEAYTTLYRVHPDTAVRHALRALVHSFLTRFIDEKSGHLRLFFDEDWQSQSSMLSFGHDIEATWLLVEAAEALGDQDLLLRCRQVAVLMANTTLSEGIDEDGGCFYETVPGDYFDRDKHWWPQAEAVVGFLNAFAISGQTEFFQAARKCWTFIQDRIKDKEQGEWHWMITAAGEVAYDEDKAGPWKGPYHNVRACMEGIRRLAAELAPRRAV